jgi:hypothetical protein
VIAAAVFALLLGAVVVCFGVPLAYGIGGDLRAATRPGPFIWMCETAAALLLWRLRRRASLSASSPNTSGTSC